MEGIVLKMRFLGKCIDVKVDDTDKCLLIDVINDLFDEAKKLNVTLPQYPSLEYTYKMKNNELKDDNTLMEMFSRLDGRKEIDIWIGYDETPSNVLTLAKNLRASQEVFSKANEVVQAAFDVGTTVLPNVFKEKLQVRRPQKPTQATSFSSFALEKIPFKAVTSSIPLGVDRTNPVLTLLEGIRRLGMVRHATRQHVAESWDDNGVCPNILLRLKALTKDSRACTSFWSSPGEYEVKDGRTFLPVSLNNRTCVCGAWQISGIPCRHAIRAIIDAKKEPSHFVSEWFSVKRYKEAYGLNISPMPDTQQWPEFDVPTLEPPTLRRSIGRPSRNRRREQGEKRKGKRSITVKCKKCNCFGHNSKTCKGGYTTKERDEMQGKIRKTKPKKGLTEDSYISPYQSLRALEGDIATSSQASQIATTPNPEQPQVGKKRKTT